MVKIFEVLRGFTKVCFSFILVGSDVLVVIIDSMLFFAPSFSNLICNLVIFHKFNCTFLNQKREFGTVNMGELNLG